MFSETLCSKEQHTTYFLIARSFDRSIKKGLQIKFAVAHRELLRLSAPKRLDSSSQP